jgi:Rps23 Pro-64 3,4-dihydroxylase Tpa1-like proline 4-hydroxylase
MIIIDNFFSSEEYQTFRSHLDREISTNDRLLPQCVYDSEEDHMNLENSQCFELEAQAKTYFLKTLVDRVILYDKILSTRKCIFRYNLTKYPYYTRWHKDRTTNWKDSEVNVFAIMFFMNKDWNNDHGGLFIYKDDDATVGKFIEPVDNRLVINWEDKVHRVLPIQNTEVQRHSLQLFVPSEYYIR